MTNAWRGKVAIITGGASGIGRAVGEAMAERGAHVVLADIQRELLAEVAASGERRGLQLEGCVLDVRDSDAVEALVRSVRDDHGRLDYMVNNAGINVAAELRDTTLEDWKSLIAVNLEGVVHGVHSAYAVMREQGFGHIVNVASAAGLAPAVFEGAYGATKHAVVGLTTTLRCEARAFGVSASVVCPGIIDTPMFEAGKYVKIDKEDVLAMVPVTPMDSGICAQAILRGIDKDLAVIVVTRHGRLLWWMQRLAPELASTLVQPLLRKLRRGRRD